MDMSGVSPNEDGSLTRATSGVAGEGRGWYHRRPSPDVEMRARCPGIRVLFRAWGNYIDAGGVRVRAAHRGDAAGDASHVARITRTASNYSVRAAAAARCRAPRASPGAPRAPTGAPCVRTIW